MVVKLRVGPVSRRPHGVDFAGQADMTWQLALMGRVVLMTQSLLKDSRTCCDQPCLGRPWATANSCVVLRVSGSEADDRPDQFAKIVI